MISKTVQVKRINRFKSIAGIYDDWKFTRYKIFGIPIYTIKEKLT